MNQLLARALVCLTFTLALLPGAAAADAVDDFVNAARERQGIPGLSIAIVRDGQLVKAAGYGLANVELDVPAKPETVYQTGSIGKQFTATAVMLLVEEGKIRLEDPLTKCFPSGPRWWKGVTVRHLLTHTSGIKDWENGTALDYRKDYTEDELAKVAMKLPADFAPGTQWRYSNTGYVLLGIIVHKASGRFHWDFLKERVFAPLGMDTARVISEADIIKNRAAGYEGEEGKLENQKWVAPAHNTTADGCFYMTVLDLAKWDAALGARKLLKPESYAVMESPVRLADGSLFPYGAGWFMDERRGEPLLMHNGAWQGFTGAILRFVGKKLTVIVLSNRARIRITGIARGIAELVEPSLAMPKVSAEVADPDPATTAAMRSLLEAWSKGAAAPRMSPRLRAPIGGNTVEKAARERARSLLEKARAFVYLATDDVKGRGLEHLGQPVDQIRYYALRGEAGGTLFRFYVDAQGDVADVTSVSVE